MLQDLIARSGIPCAGGFLAYYNDSNLYPRDPAAMFRRAIAMLILEDGSILAAPVDLTSEAAAQQATTFLPIDRSLFSSRAFGAFFFQGCYFAVRSGPFAGSYQISDDRIKNERFPNTRAYTRYLLGKTR